MWEHIPDHLPPPLLRGKERSITVSQRREQVSKPKTIRTRRRGPGLSGFWGFSTWEL